MDPKARISLPILIVQIKVLEDDSAEVFGFWYDKGNQLPRTREERRMVLQDLKARKCREVNLVGTVPQIEEILLSCSWEASIGETWYPSMEKAIEVAKRYRAIGVAFDNLLKPKGTGICKTLSVRLTEDISAAREFFKGGEITLMLAYDWNPAEGFQGEVI